jgi:hypothetical protein
MAFNTTSFLAGVGSVVAVLSTGLAGGYFLASPTHIDPPNRLQRVAANQGSKPATPDAKPEVVATAAPIVAPSPPPEQIGEQTGQTAAPAAATPAAAPEAKASEPAPVAAIQETAAPAPTAKPDVAAKTNDIATKTNSEKANTDRARAAEARAADARAADKKRAETRRIAEQQRKQRELEVATVAVRRIIHERDPSDIVVVGSDQTDAPGADRPAAEMPHFNLFGQ